jgi:predicted RNase H-like nuclease (RuvC/YqgF family)
MVESATRCRLVNPDVESELRPLPTQVDRLIEENGDLLGRLAYADRQIEELRERLAVARTVARKG